MAAEASDVRAMKMLGSHYLDDYHQREITRKYSKKPLGADFDDHQRRRIEQAEHWFLSAAEAGDPEAMWELSCLCRARSKNDQYHGEANSGTKGYWRWRAAEAGWPAAMCAMGTCADSVEERESWLRRAAEVRHPHAMQFLGELLADQGRLVEAESWLRAAMATMQTGAYQRLAVLLREQGRASELADLHGPAASGPDLPTLALTAVVTTAVVPFVQSLVAKVAEDAYGQARVLIRRMLRRDRNSPQPSVHIDQATTDFVDADRTGLVIAEDPDTGVTLLIWSNASDEALRALSALEFNDLVSRRPDQGRVRIVWNAATRTWHIRGD
ncbi:tetratricopeptide repeat protein [Streptomyces brasiliensis]|uniref:tetratricopeptide repeat protein n=1 Tax=Streptomyces brasiliensis TaxID=1954 RepID=UPI00167031BB|nr:sel1 repeat family protein [Streptomyces brasiliensis]